MKKLLSLAAGAAVLLTLTTTSQAQIIVWGTAQNMTGDADVANTGTLIDAVSFAGTTLTVNGVTFTSLPTAGNSHSDGTVTVTNGDSTGAFGAAFTTTPPSSPNYSKLVNTGTFGEIGTATASDLVTISGLTAGDTYRVESWSYYTGDSTTATNTYTGATSTTLDEHVGQYAIGTFTLAAGQTSETYNYFATGGHNFINDVAVFDVTTAGAVPEPSTYVLMGLGCLGLFIVSKRKLRA